MQDSEKHPSDEERGVAEEGEVEGHVLEDGQLDSGEVEGHAWQESGRAEEGQVSDI